MEISQSRYSSKPSWENSRTEGTTMSALTLRQSPGHHLPGSVPMIDRRISEPPSVPRSERRHQPDMSQVPSPPIQLPPIRDLVDLSKRPDTEYKTDDSPTANGKRRRPSSDEDEAERGRSASFPRYYPTQRSPRTQPSSIADLPRRPSVTYTAPGTWSSHSSPYQSSRGLPPLQTPSNFTSQSSHSNWRPGQPPTLPSLSTLNSGNPLYPQMSEYSLDPSRPEPQKYSSLTRSPFDFNHSPAIDYRSEQSHGQYSGPPSYSMGHDRSPFSVAQNFYSGHASGPGRNDREVDSRQRKRRGNLPKETTDKLRSWFMAHLQHPYPTEDEKQELMRQTGLQMNQISNWFINARRRQLPAMISNARAESDARTARSGEARQSTQNQTSDYGEECDRRESDGEGSLDDEEIDARHRGGQPGPRKSDSV